MDQDNRNLSTAHQLDGDAKRPSDTLDRDRSTGVGENDRGERAFIGGNGEVHGSGASAGGGNPGEDYDNDGAGGGGELRESTTGRTDSLSADDRQAVKNQSSVTPDDYPEKNQMSYADKGMKD